MNLSIIKFGGSLINSNFLLHWLTAIKQFSSTNKTIVVPGGGVFANKVREVQKQFKFDELIAHRMAIFAMCQYGNMLSGLNPEIKKTETINKEVIDNIDAPLIWIPLELIEEPSEIPNNWDFSSDSIALWLATQLKADNLIFIKSAELAEEKKISQLIASGKLDRGMYKFIKYFGGKLIWLSKHQYTYLNIPKKLFNTNIEIYL